MTDVALTGQLSETSGSINVTASPDAGGQLVTGVTGAYDVRICAPVAPLRLKWRIGTSGDWSEIEGGECFTVAGPSAQSIYLAKQSAKSAPVTVASTVRALASVSAAGVPVPVVTSQTNLVTGGIAKIWTGTQAQYDAIATKATDTLYVIVAG